MKTIKGLQQENNPADIDSNIFNSIVDRYDLMNDLMSLYMHRFWKQKTIEITRINKNSKVLDLASGTGDLAILIANKIINHGGNTNQLTLADVNPKMLELGIKKLNKANYYPNHHITNAEQMNFEDNSFDLITIGFGIRNFIDKAKALTEIYRVLSVNGQLVVLEFSKINRFFAPFYDLYNNYYIPFLAKLVVGNCHSYRYLVESIRTHPNQEQMSNLLINCGFQDVKFINLAFGAVAIHIGSKLS